MDIFTHRVWNELTPKDYLIKLGYVPYRKFPLIVGNFYHIFNRSVGREPIFLSNRDYKRALESFCYYVYEKPGIRFSHYQRLPDKIKNDFYLRLRNKQKQVELLGFSLMPNHFHFLVRENIVGGISNFVKNFQNSYARYFNTKKERNGSLFQSMFKAVLVESDEQLLHILRYIHLNPLTSYVVKTPQDLNNYPWGSQIDYMGERNLGVVNKSIILEHFPTLDKFKDFIYNQANYQRSLRKIRHLTFENPDVSTYITPGV